VACFAPRAQLGAHLFEHRLLRIHETLQIMGSCRMSGTLAPHRGML